MVKAAFLSLLLFTNISFASERINPHIEVPGFWDSFTNLPANWWEFKNRTVAPENRDLVHEVLALTAITVATDYQTWQFVKKHHDENRWFEVMNWHFVSAGDGFFQFGLAGAFGAYGWARKDNLALRTAQQITEVILSTGAVVQIMKHVTGREAPLRTTTPTGNWEPFPEQVKYHKNVQKYDAVPSGHLATYYATFLVIKDNYPDVKWLPWLGYSTTFLVAVGLTGTSLHWVSDYPIAIALGQVFANIVTERNHKNKKQESAFKLIPMQTDDHETLLGVRWSW